MFQHVSVHFHWLPWCKDAFFNQKKAYNHTGFPSIQYFSTAQLRDFTCACKTSTTASTNFLVSGESEGQHSDGSHPESGLSLGLRFPFFLANVSGKPWSCFSSKPICCKGPFKAWQPITLQNWLVVTHLNRLRIRSLHMMSWCHKTVQYKFHDQICKRGHFWKFWRCSFS